MTETLERLAEDVRGAARPGTQTGREATRLNVLLIMTDQQRADTLGCSGNEDIRTPHLDRLAAEGTRCERAYVQNPICMPSRATLFTGRYPRSHRVWTNGVSLPAEELTLPELLAARGYATASFGKLHFTPTGAPAGEGRYEASAMWRDPARREEMERWHGPYYGLQHVELALGHNAPGGHYGAWLRREHPEALQLFGKEAALRPPSGAHGSWKSGLPEELHSSTWVADRTISYLDGAARGTQPSFAVCSFPDPHHPFAPPAPWHDRYDPAAMRVPASFRDSLEGLPPHFAEHARGAWHRTGTKEADYPEGMPEAELREIMAHYYGSISLIDQNVGRVLDALDRNGLAENTLVVFTSDHGELLGDHGLLLKGPFLYEGLVNVPLVWRLRGRVGAGETLAAPVGHVDVASTVLEVLGIDEPLGMQGQSLAGALAGASDAGGLRPWVLTEYRKGFEPDLSLKQIHTGDGRYKLTHYGHGAWGELFDLQEDPEERVNRFADPGYAAVRRELEGLLLEALFATEDPLPPQVSFA